MEASCLDFRDCVARNPLLHDLTANEVDGQVMLTVVGAGRFPGSAAKFGVSVWLGSRGACNCLNITL